MDTLYPNLHERFETEGLCAICLMEMELTPRYSCVNGHTMCHRCKPYYYACPTCRTPMDVEILPPSLDAPPHLMPQPMPRRVDYSPSAPSLTRDFLEHERTRVWEPPTPDQQLRSCAYSHLGCWVKMPKHLQVLHESRCQFRPHLEEEHLPTDLQHRHDDLVDCPYSAAGCKVRTVPWRRGIHGNFCIYKKFHDVDNISEGLARATFVDNDYDGEQLVECKFRRYGCMVRMPGRRKLTHEQKCNYRDYRSETDDEYDCIWMPSESDSKEMQVECRWSVNGCRVRPKRYRKQIHEDKCNYKMEECAYKERGCDAMFIPARKYAHERTCEYAN
ncbi:PREDICTED: uncharacterized protein LOC106750718 [Dinoponera quadriceps]|uniref:Uncharacterized protein LOC106750718 n=1 Tax=Dinoponera quadriceps TaxID=609295 RepID=A0A6P3Y6S4_DINQU|nr:PREDICTED: uncharacterized protein LOC106750718 [Dinoponera quadriceps]